jgi:N-acetylglutamate synthase-like GNAT family acetyltransferase
MSDPRKTGISGITGKLVTVRHATVSDRVDLEEYLRKYHADSDLQNAEVVVAAEDRRIIGFGLLKKENEAGCVSVFEDSRRKGIGSTIVKHLMKDAAVKRLYASRYISYFTRYDFLRSGRPSARATRVEDSCNRSLMEPLSLAVYAK